MRPLKEEIQSCINQLQEDIYDVSPQIPRKFPISTYIRDIKSCAEINMHGYFRSRWKKIFSKIQQRYGLHALALYHKLAMASFMKDSLEQLTSKSSPKGLSTIYILGIKGSLKIFIVSQTAITIFRNSILISTLAYAVSKVCQSEAHGLLKSA
jgi:hypothetical protein